MTGRRLRRRYRTPRPARGENTSVTEEMLLDAYWANFGNAETRAALRNPTVREGLLEVVIGLDDRVEVGNTDHYPWRCIASLLITAADSSNWIGTAWLVSPRLMLTAGHCVYIHDRGGWVRQIEVIPGRRGSERPHSSCIATDFRSVRGWTENAERDFDYAAILLPENCRLGDQLGWFGFEMRDDDQFNNLTVNISGYPGDKPAGTQWFHSNVATGLDERVITYEIDTAGGQSGAPVWVFKPGSGRYGVGILSNKVGKRLPWAVISLSGTSPEHRDIGGVTDSEGRYRFDRLTPGVCTVLANAEDYPLYEKQVTAEVGRLVRLDFELEW